MPLSALPTPCRAHGGSQGWGGQGAEFHHVLFRYQVREAGGRCMAEGKHMSGGVGRLPRYPNLPQKHCTDTPAVTPSPRSVSAAHP